MQCDEARRAVNGGEPLDGALNAHLHECPMCREEFAVLLWVRDRQPAPPPALRHKVMARFPKRPRWIIAGIAAALALAMGLGFVLGRSFEAPERIRLETARVEVEKVRPLSPEEISVLAIALKTVYRGQVNCSFSGTEVTGIVADKRVMKMLPYCPVIKQMDRLRKQNPELVSLQ